MAVLPGKLAVTDVGTGATREILSIPGELVRWPTPAPDGRFVYFIRLVQSGDIWTVKFDAPDGQLARTP